MLHARVLKKGPESLFGICKPQSPGGNSAQPGFRPEEGGLGLLGLFFIKIHSVKQAEISLVLRQSCPAPWYLHPHVFMQRMSLQVDLGGGVLPESWPQDLGSRHRCRLEGRRPRDTAEPLSSLPPLSTKLINRWNRTRRALDPACLHRNKSFLLTTPYGLGRGLAFHAPCRRSAPPGQLSGHSPSLPPVLLRALPHFCSIQHRHRTTPNSPHPPTRAPYSKVLGLLL